MSLPPDRRTRTTWAWPWETRTGLAAGIGMTFPITTAVAVSLYETMSGETARAAVDCPFGDSAASDCRTDILKAYALGIVNGISVDAFNPNAQITREQLATMLCRTYKRVEWAGWTLAEDDQYTLNHSGVKKFADDADISDYAVPSVYFMVKYKVIQGMGDNLFAPKNTTPAQEAVGYANATREQAVIMSMRCYTNLQ